MKPPTPKDIFNTFFSITFRGFGGVLPWARKALVEEKRWLSEEEFADTLSLCQVLPGPNIVNLSVVVGGRLRGPRGAVAAFLGLTGAPVLIVMALGALYERFGQWPALHHALNGILAAAAGLILAAAAKMALARFRVRPLSLGVAAAAFLGAGVAALPLHWVLAGLAPISLLLSWRRWL
jgi:chromate transporter